MLMGIDKVPGGWNAWASEDRDGENRIYLGFNLKRLRDAQGLLELWGKGERFLMLDAFFNGMFSTGGDYEN